MLKDSFNRVHDYLRISLTDVCNLRCQYCIYEEHTSFMPPHQLMQADEIDEIAKVFVKLGVKKIRLTGGEPLVRKDAEDIILKLSKYPVKLTLTTNGVFADKFIDTFKRAGINSVNVSLDTLNSDKYLHITRRNVFAVVWNNIQLLMQEGFHVKMNVVLMRGVNDMEILDFIELTKEHPVHVRFIEFMPFEGNEWSEGKVISYNEILENAGEDYSFIRIADEKNDTAKTFKPLNHEGTFSVISTMSAPFCGNCNRMRLTADGKMKNCLFSNGETDILSALRNGENIIPLIEECVTSKAHSHGGQFNGEYKAVDPSRIVNRKMINIGG
ncbi:MAG: GTP 3',8-cyclase MoaA [Ignavibacteria bacterium]